MDTVINIAFGLAFTINLALALYGGYRLGTELDEFLKDY